MVTHTNANRAHISWRAANSSIRIYPSGISQGSESLLVPMEEKTLRYILQNLSFQIRIELELPDMYTHIEIARKRFAKSFRC